MGESYLGVVNCRKTDALRLFCDGGGIVRLSCGELECTYLLLRHPVVQLMRSSKQIRHCEKPLLFRELQVGQECGVQHQLFWVFIHRRG